MARPYLQVFLHCADGDGAETPVSVEIRRPVGDDVLAAQFVFDGRKRVRDVLGVIREKCAAPGGVGKLLQNLVAPQDKPLSSVEIA